MANDRNHILHKKMLTMTTFDHPHHNMKQLEQCRKQVGKRLEYPDFIFFLVRQLKNLSGIWQAVLSEKDG
jgi:hypothetical protein